MRLSQAVHTTSEQVFDRQLYAGYLQLLEHSVVKLHGNVGADNHTQFVGSGVVMRIDSDTTWILTAKHNLEIAGAGISSATWVTRFCERVRARITKRDTTTVDGTITEIIFPNGTATNNLYDVAILKMGGAHRLTFANAARDLLTPGPSTAWMYASMDWRNQRSKGDPQKPIFDLLSSLEARTLLDNGRPPYPPRDINDELANHYLLQFGHGKGDDDNHVFRRRALRISALASRTYLSETSDGFLNVFTFATDNNNTAREGDSGGPIFAFREDLAKATLIGLHLGGNFYADEHEEEATIRNNAFTIVDSDSLGGAI